MSNNDEWGWDALGEDDDQHHQTEDQHHHHHHSAVGPERSTFIKSNSDRSLHSQTKRSNASLKGITSSPSFQELEKAIGATLALSLANGEESAEQKTLSPSSSFSSSKLSSTNLTQQKVLQQRMRQYHTHRNNNHLYRQHNFPVVPNVSAKIELAPFINESESRALILFHSPSLSTNLIRDACSKYGVLYYIRPEFHNKGVTFLSYFDLQAATNAKETISSNFSSDVEISAHYSIMLHATNSNTEEFRLVVKNLPNGGSETDVQSIFSRYGQLRSIQKTFGSTTDLTEASQNGVPVAYSIEYFNIQDARLAASELSATSISIWGSEAHVKFAPLDERKQQLCRQLLAILSRWRSEIAGGSPHSAPQSPLPVPQIPPAFSMPPYPIMMPVPVNSTVPYPQVNPANVFSVGSPLVDLSLMSNPLIPNLYQQNVYAQAPTLMRSNYLPFPAPPFQGKFDGYPLPYQQSDVPPYFHPDHMDKSQSHEDLRSMSNHSVAQSNTVKDTASPISENQTFESGQLTHSQRLSARKTKPMNDKGDSDFSLDLEKILSGQEKRTTVMVRNIPNKYTQQMLLEEVNVNHNGTYDFFYLPIDFKNRCNVGYCFINFLDPKYIPAFVSEFGGQRWKSFNSEKVCAISFARIQGKSAMISRFQNSSLLDKDDEYKPLLFISSGPDVGKPEPFPSSTFKNQTKSVNEGGPDGIPTGNEI